MFISIPKEFFVPVVFGDGFVLNEENNNLELDTDLYREKTVNKYKAKELSTDYKYMETGKSIKEKEDNVDENKEMEISKKTKEENVKEIVPIKNEEELKGAENKNIPELTVVGKSDEEIDKGNNKKETIKAEPLYIPLKKEKHVHVDCKLKENIFEELDDEYIHDVNGKECSDKK